MDWKQAQERARKIAKDPQMTENLVNRAFAKTQNHPNFLAKTRRDFRIFLRMVKAQSKGLYKIPWRSLVLAVAGILYFLNPIDLIPDFIIGTGLLDDASVMLMVLRSLQKDLAAYEDWEKQQHPNQSP